MARPKKDNADYHTHDKDMRNDKKIKALRKNFSHEGYSIYNMMLEVLDDCDHFQHQWDELNIELLSGDFDIDKDRLVEIIEYSVKLGLLTISDGLIYSIKHKNRFKPLLSKRKRSDNTTDTAFPGVSDVENPHSIVKNSIVKETIVNSELKPELPKDSKTKKNLEIGTDAKASGPTPQKVNPEKKAKRRFENPATVDVVHEYFNEKMKGKWAPARILEQSHRLFNHYSANGWVQNKGKPIVNWKFAVNNWILNELNGQYSNGKITQSSDSKPLTVSAQSQPAPEVPKLSEEEKMKLAREFMQDIYLDFCGGRMLTYEGLTHYYNQLVIDGLLILTEEDKNRIKEKSGGDLKLSKQIAVEEYFTNLKDQGVKNIYEHFYSQQEANCH